MCIKLVIHTSLELYMMLKLKALQKVDQKYVERSVSYTVEQERKNLRTIKQRDVKWTGHFLCRNCLLNVVLKKKT